MLWKVYVMLYDYFKFHDLSYLIRKHRKLLNKWYFYVQLFKSNKHSFMYIVTYLNYIIQLVSATRIHKKSPTVSGGALSQIPEYLKVILQVQLMVRC